MLGNGKKNSRPLPRLKCCILDNALPPAIAKALHTVGYSFISVQRVFGAQIHGTPDSEIIEWCHEHDAIWWTMDLKARKQFKRELSRTGIPVVWLQQPRQGLAKREAFSRIASCLERVLAALEDRSGLHFEITKSGHFRILKV